MSVSLSELNSITQIFYKFPVKQITGNNEGIFIENVIVTENTDHPLKTTQKVVVSNLQDCNVYTVARIFNDIFTECQTKQKGQWVQPDAIYLDTEYGGKIRKELFLVIMGRITFSS